MRASRILPWVVLSTFLLSPAFAQDVTKAAKVESDAGARLFKEKVYEGAIQHYQKAYDLAHQPLDLQKIAESLREMGDVGRAYEAYAKLLSVHASQLGSKASAITAILTDLEQRTGLLTVHSSVTGASVWVGERLVGVTPLSVPVRIGIGSGRVTVTKEGFEPFVADFNVDPTHPATVEATPVAHVVSGHLSVRETHGVAVTVIVDGREVGPAPWEGDLPAGTHKVELASTVVKAEAQTVLLRHGTKLQTVFTGTMIAGHVHIDATPATAKILIDGKEVGVGQADVDLAVGTHAVRVADVGYKPVSQTITVEAGTLQRDSVPLETLGPAVESPEELEARRRLEDADAMRGPYGQVTVFGAFPTSTFDVSCSGLTGGPSCSDGFPIAGGLSLRGGYSLGWVGLELVGLFLADYRSDTINYPGILPPIPTPMSAAQVNHQESYTYSSAGGMIALGPRFATPGRTFRFTVAAAAGVAVRSIQFQRQLSGGLAENPTQSFSTTVVSPGITCDAGFVIGSTPGANFVIGAMMWVDFPSTQQTLATTTEGSSGTSTFAIPVPSYTVEQGAQIYIGPYLGVRFGH